MLRYLAHFKCSLYAALCITTTKFCGGTDIYDPHLNFAVTQQKTSNNFLAKKSAFKFLLPD
jgi:hypothetical protein